MDRVVTVSRVYGSGGREIGVKLAKKLGVPFYDKELIAMIAKEGNIEESILNANDEVEPDFQNYSSYVVPPHYQIAMTEQIYRAQTKVILDLAANGPCVIVGRCADVILPDSVDLFVFADMEYRIKRLAGIVKDMTPDQIREQIETVDKKRSRYHEYYSGREWGKMGDYDLCMNSGIAGIDGCLDAALAFMGHV